MTVGRSAMALMGTLAVLLGVVLLLELRLDRGMPTRPPAPAPLLTHVDSREAAWSVGSLLARPLFTPGRRPPATIAARVALATPVALPHLVGVMASGGRRTAMFSLDGGRTAVAGPGQRVDNFLVREIEPEVVTLDGAGGEHVLRLSFRRPDGASPVAAPPPLTPVPAPLAPAVPPVAAAPGLLGMPPVHFTPSGLPIVDPPWAPS